MNSKITIEIDFDNNNTPVIQIISRKSDDVRDKLIKSFLERLGQTSSWCKILCKGAMEETAVNYDAQQWIITPIEAIKLQDECVVMKEQARLINYATPFGKTQQSAIDEYVCMELQDDEGKITGLNVFYNGEIVHTWTAPNQFIHD